MATASARPASTSANLQRRRVLRIGVLLGGKIIEERLIRERVPVTIGQSAKNTFSVPLDALPRQWPILDLERGSYVLKFTQGMDGRVSDGNQVHTFDSLRRSGGQSRGDHIAFPLSDQARGKITLGELTILFQFVTEPPKQPRPMLPASVRGTLSDRIDPRLAVILALSLLIHLSVIIIARWFWDPELDSGIAEQAFRRTFDKETFDVTFEEPVAPTETAATGEQPAADKKPDAKPAADKKPAGGDSKPAATGGDRNDAAALQEEAASFADTLFSDDEGGGGLSGDMDRRKPGTDLGQQLAAVAESGKQVKIGGTGRGTRGDGDPRTGTGTGTKLSGPDGVNSAGSDRGAEKVPSGRINVADKQTFDDSTLSPDAVLAKIMSAYMAGLKRCHKELLKTDPTARGKAALKFTVNESGRVVSPQVKGFNSDLDNCIKGRMETWRFAEPKDSDGEPTDASFQITLALQPE